ncbi:MAG TPA: endonuclease/exonuclease/phosphatase family protein [Lacipirellula sp.]
MHRKHCLTLALLISLSAAAAAAGEPVRVMSFNIRYGTADDGANAWPHRRDFVVNVIEESDPDLIGLQEALRDQLDVLDDELPEYHRIGVGREAGGGGEYSAILYRASRFDVADAGTFWLSDSPEVPGSRSWKNNLPRICTWVQLLDRTNGARLYYFNTHWDHESELARRNSGKLMGNRIRELAGDDAPAVVTGDFNAAPQSPAFHALLETGRLEDTFAAVHPDETDLGTFNGFGRARNAAKIDAVLVTDHWEAKEAKIVRTQYGGRFPSDHFPVTATIKLRDETDE